MTKLQIHNGELLLLTTKQVEQYENKILTKYLTSARNKRPSLRLAPGPYVGKWVDILTKRAHNLARLVLGIGRRRVVK